MNAKAVIATITIIFIITNNYALLGQGVERKKARVIVICDASGSVRTKLGQLKNYVKEIPKWAKYPPGSEIYFYPVSRFLTVAPLGGSSIRYNIPSLGRMRREKERIEKLTDCVNKDIDNSVSETKNSCILLSINKAINKLYEMRNTHPAEHYENELVIISDLLECCKQLDTQGIEMSLANIKDLDAEIRKFSKQHTNLRTDDLNLRVTVLFNTPGMGSELSKIQKAWEKWFYSIGVKSENLQFHLDNPNFEKTSLLER